MSRYRLYCNEGHYLGNGRGCPCDEALPSRMAPHRSWEPLPTMSVEDRETYEENVRRALKVEEFAGEFDE